LATGAAGYGVAAGRVRAAQEVVALQLVHDALNDVVAELPEGLAQLTVQVAGAVANLRADHGTHQLHAAAVFIPARVEGGLGAGFNSHLVTNAHVYLQRLKRTGRRCRRPVAKQSSLL